MTRNWFESLFIVSQKLGAGICWLKFPESSTTVGLSSNRWTWKTKELPKLNGDAPWALKSQGWVTKDKHVLLRFDLTKPDHKGGPKRESKSSFSPEEPKSKILRGYCGGQLSPAFKLHWRRPGPISNPICTNGVRNGQAQCPIWG